MERNRFRELNERLIIVRPHTDNDCFDDSVGPKQLNALLQFFESNPEFATGPRGYETRMHYQPMWSQLVDHLNAMGGRKKTRKQWQKYWSDKKYMARKSAFRPRLPTTSTRIDANLRENSQDYYNNRIMAILRHPRNRGVKRGSTSDEASAQTVHVSSCSIVDQSEGEMATEDKQMEERGEAYPIVELAEATEREEDDDLNENSAPAEKESLHVNGDSEPSSSQIPAPLPRARASRRIPRFGNPNKGISMAHEMMFRIEEQRVEDERRRNEELAEIKSAVVDLGRLVGRLIECHYDH